MGNQVKGKEPLENTPITLFMGELVERRPLWLVAIVFVFALFLAAAPLLFRFEPNIYASTVGLYEKLCDAVAKGDIETIRSAVSVRYAFPGAVDSAFLSSRLRCIDRRTASIHLERLKGDSKVFYRLVLTTNHGLPPAYFVVVEEEGETKWWPDPLTTASTSQ